MSYTHTHTHTHTHRMGDDGSDHAAFVQHLGLPGVNFGFSAGSKYPTYQ